MPVLLDDWTLLPRADGFALVPPDGGEAARIDVRERLPLASLARRIEAARAAAPAAAGPIERFTTQEGEHAAIVTLTGDGFERTLGAIFADDHQLLIDARAIAAPRFADLRATVRRLLQEHALGLGERRRRRFEYAPPAGWAGFPRGLAARWCPPGYPNDDVTIVVHPARPSGSRQDGLAALLAGSPRAGATRDGMPVELPIILQRGLAGSAWMVDLALSGGGRRETVEVTLHDDRYDYLVQVEGSPDAVRAHGDAFAALLRSIQPVPRACAPVAPDLLAHWVA